MRLFKKVTSTVTSSPIVRGLSILELSVLSQIDLSRSSLRIHCISRLRKFEVTGVVGAILLSVLSNCNYKGANNSDIQGKAILNFQRGLNTKSVGISVSCDTDTPSVATKKITGNVKDFNSLVNIANSRVSTNPSYATVTLTDASGNFSITGIDSTATELTMGVTATGYDTLNQKIKLTCQNSIVTILISPVTIAAAFVQSFKEVALRLRSTSEKLSLLEESNEKLKIENESLKKKIVSFETEVKTIHELFQKAANEKKVIALEEDNKRLREDMARLRGTLEDRLRAIENLQMARK
jgi:hypothetical protein